MAHNHAPPPPPAPPRRKQQKETPLPPSLRKPVIATHIFCILAACEVGNLHGCGKSMFRCLECRVKFGFMGL